MEGFFSQAFTLLTSETGSLAFHLVLAFSIMGALQITVSLNRGQFDPSSRRLAAGLGGLLILQLLLFFFSALGWQGMLDSARLLPPLDRAVILLSTVLIIWMWTAEKPFRLADMIMLVLFLLISAGSILGILWWDNQPTGLSFNFSSFDLIVQITQVFLLLTGGLLLALLRPAGWMAGLWMMGLMLLGPILHFLFPQVPGDYSGAVRLSLIAAYPFLLYLPQRISRPELAEEQSAIQVPEAPPAATEPGLDLDSHLIQLLTQLALENDLDLSEKMVVSSMSDLAESDLCLLMRIIEGERVAVLSSGFDREKGSYLEKIAIPLEQVPILASSYRLGRIRKLRLEGASTEELNLTRVLNQPQLGNILFMPVLAPDGQPLASLVALNPHSEVDWSAEKQSRLHQLARALVYLLQRTEERLALNEEIGQTQTMLNLVQEQAQLNSLERQKLMDQLMVMRQESAMAGFFSDSEPANEWRPADMDQSLDTHHTVLEQANGALKTEGDLRMALQEIIRLRTEVAELENRLADQAVSPAPTVTRAVDLPAIESIAEDIRDSVLSIAMNNRLVLDDSAGHLNDAQRKYLERIQNSANRLHHLAGELLLRSAAHATPAGGDLQELDLLELTREIIQQFSPLADAQGVRLEADFPEDAVHLTSSAPVLKSVLSDLLKHAIASAGEQGMVGLSIQSQRAEGKPDYVLLQVIDSGQGIAAQDLMLLFSPQVGEDAGQVDSAGEVNFPALKLKIESIGGKMIADSEPGTGTTFSLLLPITTSAADELPGEGPAE